MRADLLPHGTGTGNPIEDAASRDLLDADAFGAAFRGHPAGVAVGTADAGRGPVGLTVTSVVSLSLRPPLASFAVSSRSSTAATFATAGRAAINFLDERQADLARRFAAVGVDRFVGAGWTRLGCGTPVLADPPSYVAGSTVQRFTAGDHQVVVLLLDLHRHRRPYAPLLYSDGRHGRATPATG